jgi:5'-nucleotidase
MKKIIKIVVDSKIPEKPEIKKIVDSYLIDADRALDEELGYINTPLDGRSDSVRNFETNLGNFLCDIVLSGVSAECVILNGGSMRSNQIHPAGVFKRRDLRSILPFGSELNVLSVSGKMRFRCLSNYVSSIN